ncbi:HYC_CC_PP family protein [Flavobacterium psychrotolerans]|uniref:Transmembrane protein n=1 Tax=Flavobacterium psychrotolerans TaxID=2169410 RepID=A0A2U1JN93_9FLAO|nr:hypothetical protein [Flavobacterium psychrotolerans]PWA06475.1 hypothetical protein DB895_03380 [Flavobacterium psychrotolerans]
MKFKKHISIFLAFFLLVSNVGLAFNVHYCGDVIASVSIKTEIYLQNTEKGCCKKNTAKKYSCCKDKVFQFQQKSDNLIAKAFAIHADYSFLMEEWSLIVFTSGSNFKNSQITTYYCDANAPPLFKLYNQYIFYA